MVWKPTKDSLFEFKKVRFEGTWEKGKIILRKRTPQHAFIDFAMPGNHPLQDPTEIISLKDQVKVLTEMVKNYKIYNK